MVKSSSFKIKLRKLIKELPVFENPSNVMYGLCGIEFDIICTKRGESVLALLIRICGNIAGPILYSIIYEWESDNRSKLHIKDVLYFEKTREEYFKHETGHIRNETEEYHLKGLKKLRIMGFIRSIGRLEYIHTTITLNTELIYGILK